MGIFLINNWDLVRCESESYSGSGETRWTTEDKMDAETFSELCQESDVDGSEFPQCKRVKVVLRIFLFT